jgi:ADP-dependent NAD(P)H-hydrate dehydratase / NAD(P)H-hydrate epimerase
MKILSTEDVRQAERKAISRPGGSTLLLMQAAGDAVAQFCLARFRFHSVCVVCGKGNNGGDGMVAAEALRGMGHDVSVLILAGNISELSPDAAAMCSRMNLEPVWISDDSAFDAESVQAALQADLILDAIVGTGFKPPLRGLAAKGVAAINNAVGTVVAVDLPSGINADDTSPARPTEADAVFADAIITFIAPKPAHVFGELTLGPVAVSEIGVPPAMIESKTALQVITGQEVGIAFPPRQLDAHKGDFGHVLIIAGSAGKAGAAALAGMAALHAGAGLVTVACPKSVQPSVAGFAPELMTEGLEETLDGTISLSAERRVDVLLEAKDAVVLGPGLSTHPETVELVRRLVWRCPAPLVLDADGLNAFDGHYDEFKKSAAPFRVLTPHPGEAARLLGLSTKDIQSDRLETAQRMARETGWCAVLKGSRTLVAGAAGETWINMSGNPALAKGGSGDVLSGIVGAALARRQGAAASSSMASLRDVSVTAAVHLHGLAGDIARDELHENSVLATDVIKSLAGAFHECELQMEQGLFYLQK